MKRQHFGCARRFTRYVVLHTYEIRQGWKRFRAEAVELWQYWCFRAKYSVGRSVGKKDKGDFEPLTDEQHAAISRAEPGQRGKTVSSLFDPTNDHLFTAEAAHKAFAHISASDKVKFENVCKTVDSAMAEVARKFKQLDAWPENADEALALIERFARLQHKHSSEYELELTFYYFHVSRKEIEAVLNANDKLAAASALMSEKLNRWD